MSHLRFGNKRLSRFIDFLSILRSDPAGAVGTIIVVIIMSIIFLAPLLAPYDPRQMDISNRLAAPSIKHIFGTDNFGRDIFSRILYGSRISVPLGIAVPVFAAIFGTFMGALSGYIGGRTDQIIMRVCDMLLAFPDLILAMAVASALGAGAINSMIAITITWCPIYARLVRNQVQSEMNKDYVTAAIALGASRRRVLFPHILPNCFSVIGVKVTMDIGRAIRTLAFLNFIGMGTKPPTPEWGIMVSNGRGFMINAWWFPTFPGFFIFIASLGFSLFGDALSDMFNPRVYRRVK